MEPGLQFEISFLIFFGLTQKPNNLDRVFSLKALVSQLWRPYSAGRSEREKRQKKSRRAKQRKTRGPNQKPPQTRSPKNTTRNPQKRTSKQPQKETQKNKREPPHFFWSPAARNRVIAQSAFRNVQTTKEVNSACGSKTGSCKAIRPTVQQDTRAKERSPITTQNKSARISEQELSKRARSWSVERPTKQLHHRLKLCKGQSLSGKPRRQFSQTCRHQKLCWTSCTSTSIIAVGYQAKWKEKEMQDELTQRINQKRTAATRTENKLPMLYTVGVPVPGLWTHWHLHIGGQAFDFSQGLPRYYRAPNRNARNSFSMPASPTNSWRNVKIVCHWERSLGVEFACGKRKT